MKAPTDEQLLAFLEGDLNEADREALLDALDRSPELAARLRAAATGLQGIQTLAPTGPLKTPAQPRRSSPLRWAAVAAVLTALVTTPITWQIARTASEPTVAGTGIPADPDPTFVLILHGRWPDATTVTPDEARRRASDYWGWTSTLAEDGRLVAAGDLQWEPGARLGPNGMVLNVATSEVETDEFVVGMFALRVDSYEEALAIARECPHLQYGGRVSVRRVGAGFVTAAPGDWSD